MSNENVLRVLKEFVRRVIEAADDAAVQLERATTAATHPPATAPATTIAEKPPRAKRARSVRTPAPVPSVTIDDRPKERRPRPRREQAPSQSRLPRSFIESFVLPFQVTFETAPPRSKRPGGPTAPKPSGKKP